MAAITRKTPVRPLVSASIRQKQLNFNASAESGDGPRVWSGRYSNGGRSVRVGDSVSLRMAFAMRLQGAPARPVEPRRVRNLPQQAPPLDDDAVNVARAHQIRHPAVLVERIFMDGGHDFLRARAVFRRHAVFQVAGNGSAGQTADGRRWPAVRPSGFPRRKSDNRRPDWPGRKSFHPADNAHLPARRRWPVRRLAKKNSPPGRAASVHPAASTRPSRRQSSAVPVAAGS